MNQTEDDAMVESCEDAVCWDARFDGAMFVSNAHILLRAFYCTHLQYAQELAQIAASNWKTTQLLITKDSKREEHRPRSICVSKPRKSQATNL